MQITRIAPAVLIALAVLVPGAKAQQAQTTVTLVQSVKPVTPSYPGVSADVLGIQPGMTVSQAEAIAAKNIPGPLKETRTSLFRDYRGISVHSQSFISQINIGFGTGNELNIYFSSPATGNTVYGMDRTLMFSNSLSAPLVSSVKASLIKKYGPPSSQSLPSEFDSICSWQFGKQSLNHCAPDQCGGLFSWQTQARPPSGIVVEITAGIYPSQSDNTKVKMLEVRFENYQASIESDNAAAEQLQAAAVKYYNKVSKTPAGPKL